MEKRRRSVLYVLATNTMITRCGWLPRCSLVARSSTTCTLFLELKMMCAALLASFELVAVAVRCPRGMLMECAPADCIFQVILFLLGQFLDETHEECRVEFVANGIRLHESCDGTFQVGDTLTASLKSWSRSRSPRTRCRPCRGVEVIGRGAEGFFRDVEKVLVATVDWVVFYLSYIPATVAMRRLDILIAISRLISPHHILLPRLFSCFVSRSLPRFKNCFPCDVAFLRWIQTLRHAVQHKLLILITFLTG
ncbi:hypothetical protein KC349_g55 [Hortaea werneckii]|nr:hypothetical protein KC349_g55 [Hortaea werneckii]